MSPRHCIMIFCGCVITTAAGAWSPRCNAATSLVSLSCGEAVVKMYSTKATIAKEKSDLGKLALAFQPVLVSARLPSRRRPCIFHPAMRGSRPVVMRKQPMPYRRSVFEIVVQLLLSAFLGLSPAGSASAAVPYAPRLLYPGTYGNYCGPTPEVAMSGSCQARGWRGNAPIDQVDAACLRHDLAYCHCAAEMKKRTGSESVSPSLSVLTAVRSTGLTRPLLESQGVDAQYFACVRRADQDLIQDGINVRRNSQLNGCSAGGYEMPPWFCKLNSLTLARIEFVDFDLFLRDLDFDTWDRRIGKSFTNGKGARTTSLVDLEWERRMTMRRYVLRQHRSLSDAASAVGKLERSMGSHLQD